MMSRQGAASKPKRLGFWLGTKTGDIKSGILRMVTVDFARRIVP
jgi:hypothetical protein